ncbi:hypothetical protein C8R44DRAFT_722862 [Mycena epipterygia]|nr:hypothetical protein C8R44DRAFT_722862 [Mycena epipterygia]
MDMWGSSWEENVHAGLRRFHATKGFDPNGQDIALHLGFPLYEVFSGSNLDSARVEEASSSSHVDLVLPATQLPREFTLIFIIVGTLGLILALVVTWSTHITINS